MRRFHCNMLLLIGPPRWLSDEESACSAGGQDHEDPLERVMVTHSCSLAWRVLWTEEPGGPRPQGCEELNMTEQLTHTHTPPSRYCGPLGHTVRATHGKT